MQPPDSDSHLSKNMGTDKTTDLLTPFEIWEVMLDDSTIKFHKPLVLKPMRVPDDPEEPSVREYWQVIRPELAIDVFAETRADLIEAVHSAIRLAWKHFVQVSDDRLIPATKRIRQNYLALAEAVDG